MPRRLFNSILTLLIAVAGAIAGLVATVPATNVHAGWRKKEPVYVIPTDLPNHGYHATRWHRWQDDECAHDGLVPIDAPPVLHDAHRPDWPIGDDPRSDDGPAREIERTVPQRIDVPAPSTRPATSQPVLTSPAEPPRYRTQEWTPRPAAVDPSRPQGTRNYEQPTSYDVPVRLYPSQRPSREMLSTRP